VFVHIFLARHGIHMSLDATNDDILYKLKSSIDHRKELIILPYSMETNDISLCMSQGYTGQQYGETLVDYVEQLCSEKDPRAKVVCFGLHTFIVGTPAKALHLKRALQKIKEMRDVCFLNCTQLLNIL
jgi:allantoinase